jgi:hypothetical protein
MVSFKRIFLILFLASFLLFIFSSFIFAQKTELEYPQVSGAETPTTVKTAFPEYVKYLFNLAIIIAGLIAFASLVYGGFSYLTSAGNPTAIGDAKDRITSGILGLIILLASFIILTTINPQLVNLKITPEQFQKGVILYDSASCLGSTNPQGEEGKNFLRVRRSLSSLEDFNDKTKSIYFYNSSDELEVYLYPKENYQDPPSWKSTDQPPFNPGCISTGRISGSSSIVLYWKTPGVYLFTDKECKDPNPRLFVADSGDFGDFHDKAQSIKIIPWTTTEMTWDVTKTGCSTIPANACSDKPECCRLETKVVAKFGAILHENSNFEGDAEVFFGGAPTELPPPCITLSMDTGQRICDQSMTQSYCQEHVRLRASSINVFKQNLHGTVSGDGVTLYANYDFNEETNPKDDNKQCGPFNPSQPQWVDETSGPGDCSYLFNPAPGPIPGGPTSGESTVSSIKVDGSFIAVLFRKDGRGEVFKVPGDLRLKDNNIGDDQAKYMLVIPIALEENK